jgi:hypothetical protein
MTYQKILAVLFSILSFGAIKETSRVFTSSDSDIIENKSWLLPFSVFITILFIFGAILFWKKASKQKRF